MAKRALLRTYKKAERNQKTLKVHFKTPASIKFPNKLCYTNSEPQQLSKVKTATQRRPSFYSQVEPTEYGKPLDVQSVDDLTMDLRPTSFKRQDGATKEVYIKKV